jgi:anti-sigma regulatory factor (Ser/Thr protein kinase)
METLLNAAAAAQTAYVLSDSSDIGHARRGLAELSRSIGMNDTDAGRVALVLTELSTNVLKHAGHGELLVRPLLEPARPGASGAADPGLRRGVELLALDAGSGIADLGACLGDGYSTAGSPGTGLGALRRNSDSFDIYSSPGAGTIVRATVCEATPRTEMRAPTLDPRLQIGVVCIALPDQPVCGDAWNATADTGGLNLIVADGLGHGVSAHDASAPAARVLSERPGAAPADLMKAANAALRLTRGAAVGIARIEPDAGAARFAGVGNIAAHLWNNDRHRQFASHNGIVGHAMRKVQTFSLPWGPGDCLILHSDGLGSRWALDAWPGIQGRHPSIIAAALYRDHARRRDDVTVLVARQQP